MRLLRLVLALSALGTGAAQATQKLADGFLADENGHPSYTTNQVDNTSLATNDANGCDIYCRDTYNSSGGFGGGANQLWGFSYLSTGAGTCTCYTGDVQTMGSVDTTSAATYGETYCYACLSTEPSSQPSSVPSSNPSEHPSGQPSSNPSEHPSGQPSSNPSEHPSGQPSSNPSEQPSNFPSEHPSGQPSSIPSEQPSGQPSSNPSEQPSNLPSEHPSGQPSSIPSEHPSGQPSSIPSEQPSGQPSSIPSEQPSGQPSSVPSEQPSGQPSSNPSEQPSNLPSEQPSGQPSSIPSEQPSGQPSSHPSGQPSSIPSEQPSGQPSSHPSGQPSSNPSEHPSGQPSSNPSEQPSNLPSEHPSGQPSSIPSEQPSGQPSSQPSRQPSSIPSEQPSGQPSSQPSGQPSSIPSEQPSGQPSSQPSRQPSSIPSEQPSGQPSSNPSEQPSNLPSEQPSGQPSSIPSEQPSGQPSEQPSGQPSSIPSEQPSGQPSSQPSRQPSSIPSEQPSGQPSSQPSGQPSSIPSEQPSSQPSSIPSAQPSGQPSAQPSGQPSSGPSGQPSSQPSEAPSTNPSQGCDNARTDCGWGIFNPWTCRCDCPVGICLDNNEQCYHPCRDTIHTNPWAGCVQGWDCPWYPDRDAGHCLSKMHQANNFEIYRTAKECCKEHYGGSDKCLQDSKDAHPAPWPIHFPGTPEHRGYQPPKTEGIWGTDASQAPRWFPDLTNKLNCVYGSNYENWMTTEGFEESYLFSNSEDCCEMWYPSRGSGCPDASQAVNPEAEDETYMYGSARNYYFPDYAVNNCGYGRDYPAWMAVSGFEKFYLFNEGHECCDRYFPGASNCPYENTAQGGYFWNSYQDHVPNGAPMPVVYNHTYYPDVFAATCVNGTDYPAWMASDVDFKRLYLFGTLEGCCVHWFTEAGKDACVGKVIQGVYAVEPCPENRPECNNAPTIANVTEHRKTMWYPDIDGHKCKNDGAMPSWMLAEGYTSHYLFNTRAQCCAAFGFC